MNWIRVTDDPASLPPEHEKVLCFSGSLYFTAYWMHSVLSGVAWICDDDFDIHVTHWCRIVPPEATEAPTAPHSPQK